MKPKAQREEERRQAIEAGWTTYDEDMKYIRWHRCLFILMIALAVISILKLR